MVKKFALFIIFYILVLIESSFLPHFSLAGFIPRLVFIAVFFLIFFNPKEVRFLPLFLGGFFLDVFSGGIFGLKTLSLLLAALFLKFLLDFFSRRDFFWFVFIFSIVFIFYNFSFFLFQICFKRDLTFFVFSPINLTYNLAFATLGLCIFHFSKKILKTTA